MVLPILFHWNHTHVFNSTWPGHARFHVALGDCMMFSYSVMGLALVAAVSGPGRKPVGGHLGAHCLLGLIFTGQFPAGHWGGTDAARRGHPLKSFHCGSSRLSDGAGIQPLPPWSPEADIAKMIESPHKDPTTC